MLVSTSLDRFTLSFFPRVVGEMIPDLLVAAELILSDFSMFKALGGAFSFVGVSKGWDRVAICCYGEGEVSQGARVSVGWFGGGWEG